MNYRQACLEEEEKEVRDILNANLKSDRFGQSGPLVQVSKEVAAREKVLFPASKLKDGTLRERKTIEIATWMPQTTWMSNETDEDDYFGWMDVVATPSF